VENSVHFSESLPDRYERVVCSLSSLDLADQSMDRVACLAGIHHQEDKARFFREAHRVLKPGGIVAIGDVLEGSPPARFLNEAVDRHSDLGHDGMFFAPGQLCSLLGQAGFVEPSEEYRNYTWDFPDVPTLVGFCRQVFRMAKADLPTVESELRRYLSIDNDAGGSRLGWSLLFGHGRKPAAASVR
jgi:SAM-dependent methyltransferase